MFFVWRTRHESGLISRNPVCLYPALSSTGPEQLDPRKSAVAEHWVAFYITGQIEPVIRPCSKLRRESYLSNHHQKVASAVSLGKADAAKSIIFRLVFVVIELCIHPRLQPTHTPNQVVVAADQLDRKR